MTLTLASILPNSSSGLENTGFLFGAGTSVEAGYPLMGGLTRDVVNALTSHERQSLDDALSGAGLFYDAVASEPNIETLSDIVIERLANSGDIRFSVLEARLRQLVTECILSVSAPVLTHHVRFFELLKRRAFGRAACIYIFTTNYDVLFELAGAQTGVVVETGFVGAVERFFDHQRFTLACGALQPQSRFAEHPALTVRLVKLHGSTSWLARGGDVFERHPEAIGPGEKRVMILPRRRKVLDTLHPPHDALFTIASRALGLDCKYVASCGFSFGDDHINQDLLLPAIAGGKVRLFALCAEETTGITPLKALPAFSAGFDVGGIVSGNPSDQGTDCWKFSRFVELFA